MILRGGDGVDLIHGHDHVQHDESRILPTKRLTFLLAAVLLPLREITDRAPEHQQRVQKCAVRLTDMRFTSVEELTDAGNGLGCFGLARHDFFVPEQ